jgi:hypothetical protein
MFTVQVFCLPGCLRRIPLYLSLLRSRSILNPPDWPGFPEDYG